MRIEIEIYERGALLALEDKKYNFCFSGAEQIKVLHPKIRQALKEYIRLNG